MRIVWADLAKADLHGSQVTLQGWPMMPQEEDAGAAPAYFALAYFALADDALCCAGCLPKNPERRVEVFAAEPIRLDGRALDLQGRLVRLPDDDPSGWRYQLHAARALPRPAGDSSFSRRHVLGGALAFALSAWQPIPAQAAEIDPEPGKRLLANRLTIDLHSHAGAINGVRRIAERAPYRPVAAPMRAGGMAVICLSAVSDSPVTHLDADRRIRPQRDPKPGELFTHTSQAVERALGLVREQKLGIIRSSADLHAARANKPSVIIATEGADFLEGKLERLDMAYREWHLRHLQLTHYRPNELGDIQTEPPVHGGLTDFGAAVIEGCNRLGIVVDVAHGTLDLVKRAAKVSRKPLVLSHTSYLEKPRQFSRRINAEHAKLIAGTGGVIGIWPTQSSFEDLPAMAAGMAKLAHIIGIDHVGLGSDMMGLVGPSVFGSYEHLPQLASALLQQGIDETGVLKILGGNYQRVFEQSLAS